MTIRTEIAEQLLRPKSVDAIIAAIENALPEKRIESTRDGRTYAAGQANGWNDYRALVIALLREEAE